MKRIPKQLKASIFFLLASAITSVVAFCVTPIYTRLLSADEYGKVSVFSTWSAIFGIIAMFSLSAGVFNNGMLDYPDERDKYSFSMLVLSNILTLSFLGIVLCLYPIVKSFLKLEIVLILLMFGVFLFQPAYNFYIAKNKFEYKYLRVFIFSLIPSIVSPLVAIILIILSPEGERLYPRIFGAEVALITIYMAFYFFIGFKAKWKLDLSFWKKALLFNLPLIPHYLSIFLLNSSDKIMISYLISDEATAYYSVAYTISNIAIVAWSAINSSLLPYTYEKCKNNEYEEINKITLPIVVFIAFACFCVVLLAPEVLLIMATDEYSSAVNVIPPIVGGVFFQTQYFIYANIVYYHKKPVYVMIGSVTAVVLNIVLNYFCIKEWGYQAAGYTTLACYCLQAIIDFFAMRKVVKRNVYDMKFIIIISLFVVAISLTASLIYDFAVVRYVILGLIIVLIIIFRKKFFKVFNINKKEQSITED